MRALLAPRITAPGCGSCSDWSTRPTTPSRPSSTRRPPSSFATPWLAICCPITPTTPSRSSGPTAPPLGQLYHRGVNRLVTWEDPPGVASSLRPRSHHRRLAQRVAAPGGDLRGTRPAGHGRTRGAGGGPSGRGRGWRAGSRTHRDAPRRAPARDRHHLLVDRSLRVASAPSTPRSCSDDRSLSSVPRSASTSLDDPDARRASPATAADDACRRLRSPRRPRGDGSTGFADPLRRRPARLLRRRRLLRAPPGPPSRARPGPSAGQPPGLPRHGRGGQLPTSARRCPPNRSRRRSSATGRHGDDQARAGAAAHPALLPGHGVHATCGVVPRKRLELSRSWVAEPLGQIVPSFRVGPVLVDPPADPHATDLGVGRHPPTAARLDAGHAATTAARGGATTPSRPPPTLARLRRHRLRSCRRAGCEPIPSRLRRPDRAAAGTATTVSSARASCVAPAAWAALAGGAQGSRARHRPHPRRGQRRPRRRRRRSSPRRRRAHLDRATGPRSDPSAVGQGQAAGRPGRIGPGGGHRGGARRQPCVRRDRRRRHLALDTATPRQCRRPSGGNPRTTSS